MFVVATDVHYLQRLNPRGPALERRKEERAGGKRKEERGRGRDGVPGEQREKGERRYKEKERERETGERKKSM
eukprot:11798-Amorphochlora_amoeboformis.AAC.1